MNTPEALQQSNYTIAAWLGLFDAERIHESACRNNHPVPQSGTDAVALAEVFDRHGYLKKLEDVVHISGTPLIEVRSGRGLLISCEMMLEAADRDPIAARLLTNLLKRLAEG